MASGVSSGGRSSEGRDGPGALLNELEIGDHRDVGSAFCGEKVVGIMTETAREKRRTTIPISRLCESTMG